jgi:hypothetical protein
MWDYSTLQVLGGRAVPTATRRTQIVHPRLESCIISQTPRRAIVEPMEVSVAKKSRVSFDPKRFLAKVGGGKTITKYQNNQIVFSQGDVADAVFYVQKGMCGPLGARVLFELSATSRRLACVRPT